jgi:hypothetical protein
MSSIQGDFDFVGLPPADYRLEGEAAGFRLALDHITSNAGLTAEAPMRLKVGNLTESIAAPAGQEPLQRSDGIPEPPLNSRNIAGLLSPQPGVTHFAGINGTPRPVHVTPDGVDNIPLTFQLAARG